MGLSIAAITAGMGGGRGPTSVALWTAVLVVLIVIGFVVVVAVRRHYYSGDDAAGTSAGPGFTLQQLRQMRRDGEITEQQYEKLRQHVIGAVTASNAADAAPEPTDEADDHPADTGRDADEGRDDRPAG